MKINKATKTEHKKMNCFHRNDIELVCFLFIICLCFHFQIINKILSRCMIAISLKKSTIDHSLFVVAKTLAQNY